MNKEFSGITFGLKPSQEVHVDLLFKIMAGSLNTAVEYCKNNHS